jgi:hypothetical protein
MRDPHLVTHGQASGTPLWHRYIDGHTVDFGRILGTKCIAHILEPCSIFIHIWMKGG